MCFKIFSLPAFLYIFDKRWMVSRAEKLVLKNLGFSVLKN